MRFQSAIVFLFLSVTAGGSSGADTITPINQKDMNRSKLLILAFSMACFCAFAQTPKTIRLTNDVPYRDGSASCVLDIADPLDFGGPGLRPALVIIHGGGWSMGSKNVDVYRGLMIDYALQGYLVINVEYRLQQEGGFQGCIEDVKCAVRWLKAHSSELRVDPERIGAYGHSAGAHLAMKLAVSAGNKDLEGDGPWKEYSSAVTCIAAGSPPTQIGRPIPMHAEHPEWWPIGYYADAAKAAPQFLLQGTEDPVVKAELTEDYVNKMRAGGAKVDFLKVEGDHDIAYSDALNITKPAMDRFFESFLKK